MTRDTGIGDSVMIGWMIRCEQMQIPCRMTAGHGAYGKMGADSRSQLKTNAGQNVGYAVRRAAFLRSQESKVVETTLIHVELLDVECWNVEP